MYKTQEKEQEKRKEEANTAIKVLVGVGFGSLFTVVISVAGIIGTIAYRKRMKRKEKKSKQLAEKTNEEPTEGEFTLVLDEDGSIEKT